MRKAIFTRIAAPVAVISAVLGLGLASASAAGAATVSPKPLVNSISHDTAGVTGYYENNDGAHNFRDARATFPVTAQMAQLTDGSQSGAVGVELCNPNNDRAIQAGVAYLDPSTTPAEAVPGYYAAYAVGSVTPNGGDACVTGGLAQFQNVFGGNIASQPIAVGDTVTVEVYANPKTGEVTLTATDNTEDNTSQAHVWPQAQLYREAGIGLFDANYNSLVPPAINLVTTLTGRFTNTFQTGSGTTLTGHGDLKSVTGLNALGSTVLVPSGLTGGKTFSISAGVSGS